MPVLEGVGLEMATVLDGDGAVVISNGKVPTEELDDGDKVASI